MNLVQMRVMAILDMVRQAAHGASRGMARPRPSRDRAVQLSHAASQAIERRQLDRARRLAETAIATDPTWGDGYRMLGLAYLRAGQPAPARRAYETGARALPQDGYIMGSLGDLEWKLERYPEAEAAFRRALALAPQHREAGALLINLALAIAEQGRFEDAVALLEAERKRGAASGPMLVALGEILIRQGRDIEAAAVSREAIARDPLSAAAHYSLGYALYRMGDQRDAAPEIRRAVELDPSRSEYRIALARLGEEPGSGARMPNPPS